MNATDTSIELLVALQTRREYSRALLHLAQEQQQAVAEDRMPDLIQLIAKQDRLIKMLHELEQSRGDLTAQWKQLRNELPATTRFQFEAVIAETKSLMAQTLACNQLGTEALTARRDETQRELRELGLEMEERRAELHRAPTSMQLDFSV